MASIPLDELTPGMVLTEAACDTSGRVLLTAGTEVKERHIKVLRTWGVVEVSVKGDGESDAGEQISPQEKKLALAYVKEQFKGIKPGEFTKEVMRRCAVRKAERLSRKLDSRDASPITVFEPVNAPETPRYPLDSQALFAEMELASLPSIFNELIEVVNNPRSSSAAIGKVVSKDTSLSARLLKIVNSPFYAFPSKIDTISRAVTVIGTRQLTTLAVGICAMDMFRDMPSGVVDMTSFWKHSIGTGLLCRIMATLIGLQNTERLFVSGLLHDIGHLVLFKYLPDKASATIMLTRANHSFLSDEEQRVFGLDHAKLGADLLREWKLPPTLENNVRFHNEPLDAPDKQEASVVCVANALAYALEFGNAGECRLPSLENKVFQTAGLSPAMIGETIRQADMHYGDLTRMFLNG